MPDGTNRSGYQLGAIGSQPRGRLASGVASVCCERPTTSTVPSGNRSDTSLPPAPAQISQLLHRIPLAGTASWCPVIVMRRSDQRTRKPLPMSARYVSR